MTMEEKVTVQHPLTQIQSMCLPWRHLPDVMGFFENEGQISSVAVCPLDKSPLPLGIEMTTPTNYPAYTARVTPEANPNTVHTEKLECEQKFSKVGKPVCVIIRNTKNQPLILTNEKNAVFEEMTDLEFEDITRKTQFMMQRYKDTDPTCLLVAISVKTPEKIYTLSCEGKTILLKEEAAPDDITDEEKSILFCEEKLIGRSNKRHFKSLLYPQYYLACEMKKNTLILKEWDENKEESTVFVVQYYEEIGS